MLETELRPSSTWAITPRKQVNFSDLRPLSGKSGPGPVRSQGLDHGDHGDPDSDDNFEEGPNEVYPDDHE